MGRTVTVLLASMVAGLLGAAGRAAVLYVFWLRGADEELSELLLFVSAGIGFLVGIIAVLVAAPGEHALGNTAVSGHEPAARDGGGGRRDRVRRRPGGGGGAAASGAHAFSEA